MRMYVCAVEKSIIHNLSKCIPKAKEKYSRPIHGSLGRNERELCDVMWFVLWLFILLDRCVGNL